MGVRTDAWHPSGSKYRSPSRVTKEGQEACFASCPEPMVYQGPLIRALFPPCAHYTYFMPQPCLLLPCLVPCGWRLGRVPDGKYLGHRSVLTRPP
jgi:hypothetical protein